MPVATIASMSKEAGISLAKGEELWSKAKKAAGSRDPDKTGKSEDYAYVMGIWKKMAGLSKSSESVESLVDLVIAGHTTVSVLESLISESQCRCKNFRRDTESCLTGCSMNPVKIPRGNECPWSTDDDEAQSVCRCYKK